MTNLAPASQSMSRLERQARQRQQAARQEMATILTSTIPGTSETEAETETETETFSTQPIAEEATIMTTTAATLSVVPDSVASVLPIVAIDGGNSTRKQCREVNGTLEFTTAVSSGAAGQTYERHAKQGNLAEQAASHAGYQVIGLTSDGRPVPDVDTVRECVVVLEQISHFRSMMAANALVDLGGGTTHIALLRGEVAERYATSLGDTGVLAFLDQIVRMPGYERDFVNSRSRNTVTRTQLGVILSNLGDRASVDETGALVFGPNRCENWTSTYAPVLFGAIQDHLAAAVDSVRCEFENRAAASDDFGADSEFDPKTTFVIGGGAALLVALAAQLDREIEVGARIYHPSVSAVRYANAYAAYRHAGGTLSWTFDPEPTGRRRKGAAQ